MYKHWRYLPAQPERPYPFYAQFSPEFDATEKTAGLPNGATEL
jgi:hypothetical protein